METKPTVSIEYCTVCNFRARAAWLAQELLAALEADIAGVTLVPVGAVCSTFGSTAIWCSRTRRPAGSRSRAS